MRIICTRWGGGFGHTYSVGTPRDAPDGSSLGRAERLPNGLQKIIAFTNVAIAIILLA